VIPVALVAAQSTTVLISTGGALLGVLVGGAINWAIQSGNERRRERTLAQAGVRLVSAELADCDRELEETLKDLVWRRTRTLPTNAWATYRWRCACRQSILTSWQMQSAMCNAWVQCWRRY
jgi:hypothetical protein